MICPHCGKETDLLTAQDAAPKKRTRKVGMSFAEWMATLPEDGVVFGDESTPYKYAEKVGLPTAYLDLAWDWFSERYGKDKKSKYKDWPAHFLSSVRGIWSRYWRINREGVFYLTAEGLQAQKELHAEA